MRRALAAFHRVPTPVFSTASLTASAPFSVSPSKTPFHRHRTRQAQGSPLSRSEGLVSSGWLRACALSFARDPSPWWRRTRWQRVCRPASLTTSWRPGRPSASRLRLPSQRMGTCRPSPAWPRLSSTPCARGARAYQPAFRSGWGPHPSEVRLPSSPAHWLPSQPRPQPFRRSPPSHSRAPACPRSAPVFLRPCPPASPVRCGPSSAPSQAHQQPQGSTPVSPPRAAWVPGYRPWTGCRRSFRLPARRHPNPSPARPPARRPSRPHRA